MLRKVLPAYAGVVRRTSSGTTSPSRSPRLRGGGPRFWIMLYGASAFSPPTRGSEDVAAEELLGCVLLAYAGDAKEAEAHV